MVNLQQMRIKIYFLNNKKFNKKHLSIFQQPTSQTKKHQRCHLYNKIEIGSEPEFGILIVLYTIGLLYKKTT